MQQIFDFVANVVSSIDTIRGTTTIEMKIQKKKGISKKKCCRMAMANVKNVNVLSAKTRCEKMVKIM